METCLYLVSSSQDQEHQGNIWSPAFFLVFFSSVFLKFVSYHNGLIDKMNHIHLAVVYTICVSMISLYSKYFVIVGNLFV